MSVPPESEVDPWAEAEAAVRRERGEDADALARVPPATPAPARAAKGAEAEVERDAAEGDAAEGAASDGDAADGDAADGDAAEGDALGTGASEAPAAAVEDSDEALEPALAEGAEGADDAAEEAAPLESDGLDDDTLLRAVSALVLAAPEPLTTGRIATLVGEPDTARVRAALQAFGERLVDAGLGVELREIAGGWRLVTDPALAELVGQMFASRKTDRISQAGLETLSIVAYRQPVTKAEIEAIRGVQAGPILRTLVDRGLIRVTGRADQPGSPLLYGTTRMFLDRFGLARIEDLPRDGELARD